MNHRGETGARQAQFLARQLEAMPDVGWLRADPAAETVSISTKLSEHLGLSTTDGRTSLSAFLGAVHPSDRTRVAEALAGTPTDGGCRRGSASADDGSCDDGTETAGGRFEFDCRLLVAPDGGDARPAVGADATQEQVTNARVRGETRTTDPTPDNDTADGEASFRRRGDGGTEGGRTVVRATVRFLDDAPTAHGRTETPPPSGTDEPPRTSDTPVAAGSATPGIRLNHNPFVDGPVVVFRWTPKPGWPVDDVSPNVEGLLGYTPDELLAGEPPYEALIHPADRDRVARRVETNSENGTTCFQHEPYRLLTADGEVRWVLDCTRIVRDDDGAVEAYTGYLVDITAQRRSEIGLAQVESLGEFGSWQWCFNNDSVQWSEGLYDLFECDPEDGPLSFETVLSYVHPDDRNRLRAVWEEPIEESVVSIDYRLQIDGQTKWIDSRIAFEHGEDGSAVSATGVLRDVTTRVRRERGLRRVNETIAAIVGLETPTPDDVLDRIVECAADLLNSDAVCAHVLTDDGCLSPAVATDDTVVKLIEPEDGALWDAFLADDPSTIDTAAVPSSQLPEKDPPGSVLVVSVGDRGALFVGAAASLQFDDDTVELVELLASTAAGALERVDRTEALRERTAELSAYAEELERIDALNEVIRSLQRALVESDSREVLFEETCRALTRIEGFDGAWVGELDIDTDRVVPMATSMLPEGYLDAMPLSAEANGTGPASRAIKTRSFVGPITVSERLRDEPWRRTALENGYRSVLSIPIEHAEITYGVLTIYTRDSNTFDESTIEILRELGALAGYALMTIEQRAADHSDGRTDMVFDVPVEETDPFAALADRLSTTVEIRNVSQRNRNANLSHCLVSDVDDDSILDIGSHIANIDAIKPIEGLDGSAFEITTVGESIAAKVTTLGVLIQRLRISPSSAELVVTVGRSKDPQQFSRRVDDVFGASEFKAKRESSLVESVPWLTLLSEKLTEKQHNVLRTAYCNGYFEPNRSQTGAEIASSLGIAQSTFSKHIRAAQRNLFSAIWNEPLPGTDRS